MKSEHYEPYKDLKRSLADLIVVDDYGNQYIVEIEREHHPMYIEKACFNTSKVIIDTVREGSDFRQIKKLFHISLLYYTWDTTHKPLYYGKAILHEDDLENPLDLSLTSTEGVVADSIRVFPEYFVISISMFDDVIRQDIDEWIYVIKHRTTKKEFISPYIKKLEERLNLCTMNWDEQSMYCTYIKTITSQRNILRDSVQGAISEGRFQGMDEVRVQERERIAKELYSLGVNIEMVQKVTGLSKELLEKLFSLYEYSRTAS